MFAHLHSSHFYKRNSVRHHLKDIQHLSHIVLPHKSFPLLNINTRQKIADLYFFFLQRKDQLSQYSGCLTAEKEVAGSNSGTGPYSGFKITEERGLTVFVLQIARPSPGSDDHVKWQSRLQQET